MPDSTQLRTCGIKIDEAEELVIEPTRNWTSQSMLPECRKRARLANVANETTENRFRSIIVIFRTNMICLECFKTFMKMKLINVFI